MGPASAGAIAPRAEERDLDGGRHLDEVNRVDDADAAAGHRPENGLAVEEARVHPCRDPRTTHADGARLRRRTSGRRDLEGRAERPYPARQPDHRPPVPPERVGVRPAVPVHVRQAIRLRRVGPGVVGLREVVVDAARALLRPERGDGHRRLREERIGSLQHAGAVVGRDIDEGGRRRLAVPPAVTAVPHATPTTRTPQASLRDRLHRASLHAFRTPVRKPNWSDQAALYALGRDN